MRECLWSQETVGVGDDPLRALSPYSHRWNQGMQRALSFGRALPIALGRAALEIAANRGTAIVDGAPETTRLDVDREGRAVSILDAHVSAVADEMDEPFGVIAEPRVVVPGDLDVAFERRKAADAAFDARGEGVVVFAALPR